MPDFEFDSAKKGTSESTDKTCLSDDNILDLIDIVEEGDVPDDLDVNKTNDMQFNEAKADEELNQPDLEKISSETDELFLDEELDTTEPLETDTDKTLDDINSLSETDAFLDAEALDLVDASEETGESELEDIALDSDELYLDEELDSAESLEFNIEKSLESIEESQKDDLSTGSGQEQKLSGISEERIEALITKTVQDVVEKVARETMTNVAEKLINDAIEALKQTLEPFDS